MRKNIIFPILIFCVVSFIFSSPILKNITFWGQMDWDQFTFWNAVPKQTLLEYNQFPLWNPFANGGNVLLAHPHSPFLSPFYILVLLLGAVFALKLEIIIHLFIGLMGMFFLARYIKVEKQGSYLAAFIYMLSSVYALHLTEGHTEWLAMAFMPCVFLYYLKSWDTSKHILTAILFFALIFLSGSVDVLLISFTFLTTYAFLKSIQIRKITPLRILLIIFTGTFLLCAIKMIPLIEFLLQYPRSIPEMGTTGPTLHRILLSKEQAFLDILGWETTHKMGWTYAWHEYGAYVGIIPIFLFICGAMKRLGKNWPLILTGVLSLIITAGYKDNINLWWFLHKLPIYSSFRVPPRFILGFIFILSLFAGFGLSFIENLLSSISKKRHAKLYKTLSIAIIIFISLDLWSVNSPIFKNAFHIPPMKVERNATFAQRYNYMNFFERKKTENVVGKETSKSSKYPIFLSNSGILDAYEVVGVKPVNVRVSSDPHYKGEFFLEKGYGTVSLKHFSPNRITLDVTANEKDTLVINQNYYIGWKVENGGRRLHAESFNGLIATPVLPGKQEIVFYFMPFSFLLGLFISSGFILILVLHHIKKRKQ